MDSERNNFVACRRCGSAVVETTSSRYATTSYSPVNPLCHRCLRICNNSHQTQVRRSSDDREWDLFHQESPSDSSHGEDEAREGRNSILNGDRRPLTDHPDSTITDCFPTLAIQSSGTVPQQESCSDSGKSQNASCHVESFNAVKFPVEVTDEHGGTDDGLFCSNLASEYEQCILVLFKRGIISRENLTHVLYILPKEKFSLVFPRIKQFEAVVYHGTEFPMGEEGGSMCECSLFHDLFVTDELTVRSEMVSGKNFTIASSSMQVASVRVSQVKAASVARIDPGVKVKLSITCTGSKDALWKDSVRLTLQTGETTLHMIFATACHETNISPWLYDCSSVTRMPDEDRQALRSCHVDLIHNIGDVLSICEYFYQHGIFDGDDIDELKSIRKTTERIADFLRRLPTRGNILDLLVDIMRCQRENQGAADILLQKRFKSRDFL